ncbi:MAG: stalk domain-containing protein [Syntrophomonas sp.]
MNIEEYQIFNYAVKRKIRVFQLFVLTILFLLFLSGTVLAQPSIILDNKPLTLDVEPVIENGRTLVPLGAILKALDTEVTWDADTQTVHAQKGSKVVVLTIGDTTAYVDQKPVTLDVPGKIVNGRTMVPLGFVSTSFGAKVQYDSVSNTIFIYSNPNAPSYVSYTDKANRFKIMHPSDWEASENELGVNVIFLSPKSSSFTVCTEDLPGTLSLEFYEKLSIRQLKNKFPDFSILESHIINIGNNPAHQIICTYTFNGQPIKLMMIEFVYEDKAYVLGYGGSPEEFNTYLDIAQTMANTFRLYN